MWYSTRCEGEWLGGAAFLARMQRLVSGQWTQAVPREQTQTARPDAGRVLATFTAASLVCPLAQGRCCLRLTQTRPAPFASAGHPSNQVVALELD